jgi:hypothetical protein
MAVENPQFFQTEDPGDAHFRMRPHNPLDFLFSLMYLKAMFKSSFMNK